MPSVPPGDPTQQASTGSGEDEEEDDDDDRDAVAAAVLGADEGAAVAEFAGPQVTGPAGAGAPIAPAGGPTAPPGGAAGGPTAPSSEPVGGPTAPPSDPGIGPTAPGGPGRLRARGAGRRFGPWTIAAGAGAAVAVVAVTTIVIVNSSHHSPPPVVVPDMVIQAAPCTPPTAPGLSVGAPAPAPAATPPGPPLPTTSPPAVGPCRTVATEATFRFAPTADPLGFDCSLDGARFAPCRSPATFRRLRPGPHVFRVRAVDATAVGRPSAFRWEVLPPPPVPLPDLVISTYTGTTVVVRNVGDGPAGASTLFLGSAGYFPVPALPVNGQRTIQHLPCPAGASSAVVDVANQVVEQDEGNNLAVGGPFACVPPVRIPTSPPASPSTPASASASASAPASTPPTSAPPTTSATSNAPPSTKAPTRPPTTGASPPPSTQRLTVRVRDGGFGSVNGPKIQCGSICAADVPQGTQVVLTANPTDTGRFVRWGGDCSGTSGTTCVLTMSSSRTVRAAFGPARAPLAVRVSGRKFGAVTGPGIQCGSACAAAYRQGSVVTLFADPAGSGRFLGWGGDCAGSKGDTCQLVMDSAKQVSASFAPAVAHLRVVVRGSDKGTVTGPKIQWGKACLAAYLQGTAVTPIAAPVAGAVFKGWAGACQGVQTTCTLTPGPRTIVIATFE